MDYFYDKNKVLLDGLPRTLDKRATARLGVNTYLKIPDSTIEVPPSLGVNEAAQFNEADDTWSVVVDFRGDAWNTQTKEQVLIEEVGDLPAGFTNIIPPGDFALWDTDNWDNNSDYEDLYNAKIFISDELKWCDIEVRKHQSGHTRTTSTEALINVYSCELRDYVQNDVIETAKPNKPN